MENKNFNILVLDGGGSKGIYTLGVLKELELKFGSNLCNHFNLIYGTSTGSIIASLIALGHDVATIETYYYKFIPQIMYGCTRFEKSLNLKMAADEIFGDKKFDSFKTDIGIVSLNYDLQQPLIFKTNKNQAHGMKQSFEAGFGRTISDAVQCSCSAYPVFDIKEIELSNQGSITEVKVIDGGFIANNPTLYALVDAHKAFNQEIEQIRLLNVGVGKYVEKSMGLKFWFLKQIKMVKFVERVLNSSTNTNTILTKLLYPDIKMVRISDTFSEPEYGTNMIEIDEKKLNKLNELGRRSYAKFEQDIIKLFNT